MMNVADNLKKQGKQAEKMNNRGFTLIELIVVMFILLVALALSTNSFVTVLKNSKQQSKVAEAQMEKIIGLELLRWDIEHAGLGLPWYVNDINTNNNFTDDWNSLTGYNEAAKEEVCNTGHTIDTYNDAPNNAPRAVVGGNNVCANGTDYLVIKSTVVRNSDEAQKWTYIWNDGTNDHLNCWSGDCNSPDPVEDIQNNTMVIAIKPVQTSSVERMLLTYSPQNSNDNLFGSTLGQAVGNFTLQPKENVLLFAVGPDNSLRMPFNRADYYISTSNVPAHCAPGTGVLRKSVVNQSDGKLADDSPLIDCVADFQVILGLDMDEDGVIGTFSNADGSSVVDSPLLSLSSENATAAEVQATLSSASLLRKRLKEIRIYILAQEGQRDMDYNFGQQTVTVGEFGLGRNRDLSALVGDPEYSFYRWKVYTLIVKPENISGQ